MSTLRTNTLQTLDSSVTVDIADLTTLTGLSNTTDPLQGVALVGGTGRVVNSVADLITLPKEGSKSAFVLGYYTAGDAGGGTYRLDLSDTTSPSNGGTIIVAADGGRWKLSQPGLVSIRQFGAKTDGTDAGLAINASLQALNYAVVPAGTFTIATTIALTANGQRLIGHGRAVSILSSITTGHSVTIAANLQYVTVSGFSLTRPLGNYGNTAGKDGVHCDGYAQLVKIDEVEVFRHWRGLSLGPTSYSLVSNYLIDNNYDSGIFVQGTAAIGAMQWTFIKGISQRNNGHGMRFQTVAGPVGASMGDLVSVSTYGNRLNGISWQGSVSCPINAIRVRGAFVGEEGLHGIHLDTFGVSTHTLADVFSEICGTLACGVDGTTPPTNQGRGFEITANQQEVIMTGCNAIGNSWSGVGSSCPRLTITGGSFRLNGAALLSGDISGISLNAGSANIVGPRCNGNKGYGVFLANDNHEVVGTDLRENLIGALGAGVTLTNSIDVGNRKT
jgi:hypothetical protein